MPEETNVEIAREAYRDLADALRSGDLAGVIERWCDPEIVLQPAGVFPDSASVMHGHEGMLSFLSMQMEAFEALEVVPLEFIGAGNQVVVPVRFGGRARHTGLEIDFSLVHVLTLRDRTLLRMDAYASRPEALEALGLSD